MATDRTSVMREPSGAPQAVAYTGTAGVSTKLPPGISCVMFWCTTDAYVIVGPGVSATTANGTPVPSYTPFWLPVTDLTGAPILISAIRVSSDGTMYCRGFV